MIVWLLAIVSTVAANELKACYNVQLNFEGWDEPGLTGEVFSPPVLVVHSGEHPLIEMGEAASAGLALLAEQGDTSLFITMLQAKYGFPRGDIYRAEGPVNAAGDQSISNVCVDSKKPNVAVFSMIAPSPDWFIYRSINLLEDEDTFADDETLTIGPDNQYDAGTDSGTDFTSINCPTRAGPSGVILRLDMAGNVIQELTSTSNGDVVMSVDFDRTSMTRMGGLSPWTATTQCSASCRGGTLTESRSCNDPTPIGGAAFQCTDFDGTVVTTQTRTRQCNEDVMCTGGEDVDCYTLTLNFQWREDDGRDAGSPPDRLILEHMSPPLISVSSEANKPFDTSNLPLTSSLPGLELLAETGNARELMDTFIDAGLITVFEGQPAFLPWDEHVLILRDICLTPSQNVIQLFSMLAPSPDWFLFMEANVNTASDDEITGEFTAANFFDADSDDGPSFLSPDDDNQGGRVFQLPANTITLPFGSFSLTKNPTANDAYGPWGRWGDCSMSCNGGIRSRTRDCVGNGCANGATETQYGGCNGLVPCPYEVCYSVQIRSQWTESGVPDAHMSPPVAVGANQDFLNPGEIAPAGLEALAETGATGGAVQDLYAAAKENNEDGNIRVEVYPNGPIGPGSDFNNGEFVYVNEGPGNYICLTPYRQVLTVWTMIAPSPDWFIMAAFRPYEGGEWIDSATNLCPSSTQYDVGGDGGQSFNAADDDESVGISTLADAEDIVLNRNPNPPCTIVITRLTDVVYGEWSKWGECSKMCRGGHQTRTRRCLTGDNCAADNLIDYQRCYDDVPCDGEICYSVVFTPRWYETTGDLGTPGNDNEHFSPVTVIVSDGTLDAFDLGTAASNGVESIAETGNNRPLLDELDKIDGVYYRVGISAWIPYRAQLIDHVCVTSEMSQITVVSMIAPSPDWMIYYTFDTQNNDGKFMERTMIVPQELDAGTDAGPDFTSENDDENDVIRTLADAAANSGDASHVTALQPEGAFAYLDFLIGNAPKNIPKCCNPLKEPGFGENAECPSGDALCCAYTGDWECSDANGDFNCPTINEGEECEYSGVIGDSMSDVCSGFCSGGDSSSKNTKFHITFNNEVGSCGCGNK